MRYMAPSLAFRRTSLILVALAGTILLSRAALADPPAGFDQRVEQLRKEVGVPGMAIAIVEHGTTTLAKGYGMKRLGGEDPVDADTIFPIGSTTKAFTVADLAILVDEGKIDWDDPVIDHLPWFQMYDPWVTREITIRDLLVHRSGLGLGEGDLLMVPRSNIPRKEAVRRLRYLKPKTSFRSGYAYDNVLYMVAGQLIEEVTGESWEKFTAEHILKPAGMLDSTSGGPERFEIADRAQPHARTEGPLRGAGRQVMLNEHDELSRSGAPAGGLAVSANDFARWLKIQLAHGTYPDREGRLFSEAAHEQMWTPVVIEPNRERPPELEPTRPTFSTYALGWDVQDYRGTKIVWHGGAVFGFQTAVVLIPEKNIGFSIQINSEDGEIIMGMMYELLDHYLGLPADYWPEKLIAFKKRMIEGGVAVLEKQTAKPADVGPSLPLNAFTGTYADPWYGKIVVGRDANGLTIDFTSTPRMGGRLEHWQYDTFVTRLTDPTIEPAYVTFNLDADGNVTQVTMKPVSPLADFSYDYDDLRFTPVGEKQAGAEK